MMQTNKCNPFLNMYNMYFNCETNIILTFKPPCHCRRGCRYLTEDPPASFWTEF